MRARCAVPIANQVTIAKQGKKHSRTREHTKSGGQCQVAASRTTGDCNPGWIDIELSRTVLPDPFESVLDVVNYFGKLCFRRKPIIERDQDMACLEHALSDSAIDI